MPIGASEYKPKSNYIVVGAEGGGAPAQSQAVVQCIPGGLKQINLKNMGDEAVTYVLIVRGRLFTVAAENINALRVGVTDQYQGVLANNKIVESSVTITDAAAQVVTDDGNGNLVTGVLATIVGTIDYESGAIDFTYAAAVTPAVTVAYQHRGWVGFTAPITGTVAVGGGEVPIVCLPTGGDNYIDGIKGMTYIGLMLYSAGVGSKVGVEAIHVGDDTNFKLVPAERFRPINTPSTQA